MTNLVFVALSLTIFVRNFDFVRFIVRVILSVFFLLLLSSFKREFQAFNIHEVSKGINVARRLFCVCHLSGDVSQTRRNMRGAILPSDYSAVKTIFRVCDSWRQKAHALDETKQTKIATKEREKKAHKATRGLEPLFFSLFPRLRRC